MRRGLLVGAAGLAVTAALSVGPAYAVPPLAHARLQGATPAADSVLAEAPPAVVLTFTRDIAPPATVVVTAPSGDRVGTADPVVRGPAVTAPVAADEQGTYTVAYRAVSVDGHPIQGRYTFSVGHRTAAYVPPDERPEGTPTWVVPASAGAGAAAAGGLVLWLRRRRRAAGARGQQ